MKKFSGKKELLSQKLLNKKEEQLLKEGSKSHMQGMWLCTLNLRWQKIPRFYNLLVKAEQSSFLEWNKNVEEEEEKSTTKTS